MGLFKNIDWRVQVTNILPPVIRESSLIDFVTALLGGLKTDSDAFSTFEDSVSLQAKFNGQKMVMQAALNTIFNVLSAPYIIVQNNSSIAGEVYIFNEPDASESYSYAEADSTKSYQLFAFVESDLTAQYDFTVKIPSGIYTTELNRQVTAYVNIYKLTGKTFNTITY